MLGLAKGGKGMGRRGGNNEEDESPWRVASTNPAVNVDEDTRETTSRALLTLRKALLQ